MLKKAKAKQAPQVDAQAFKVNKTANVFTKIKAIKPVKIYKTAQDTLHYQALFDDGVCALGDGYFSATLKFNDINYIEAGRDVKIDVFAQYCDFINSFDTNVHTQITIFNRHTDLNYFKKTKLMELDGKLDDVKGAYNRLLLEKVNFSKNNVIREKYVTIKVKAPNLELGTVRLRRECEDTLEHFAQMDLEGYVISGSERLELMSRILRPKEEFIFDYSRLAFSNLTTKDFITPYFDLLASKQRIGIDDEAFTQTLQVFDLSTEMSDKIVSDLMEIPIHMNFNLHFDVIEKDVALKVVKDCLAGMDIQQRDDTKRLIRDVGVFDESLLPRDLLDFKKHAEKMLRQLRDGEQKMFKVTILINYHAGTLAELKEAELKIKRILNRYACKVNKLIDLQVDALNASLPLGRCDLPVNRTFTTAAVGIFIPFTTQELFHEFGIYRGINQASKNLLYLDRLLLHNANGFVLAESGGGKSFQIKDEIVQMYLKRPNDDFIAIDPEREYTSTSQLLNGEVIHISADSPHYVNPFDITMNYAQGSDPVRSKAEFVLTFIATLINDGKKLTPAAKTVIDRVTRLMYEVYLANPKPENMPTLKDFYQILQNQSEEIAHKIALDLEMYVVGSLNVFAHQTNVDVNNRFVVYDIKDLGENLMTVGLLITLDQVRNKISNNREDGKRTWIYIDEVYLLFENELSAMSLFKLYKRVRKWGASITAATQNVEDVLLSDVARRMLANSQYVMMLSQAKSDRTELASLFNLSEKQLKYITNGKKGTGIIRAGKNIIPFDARIDACRDKILFDCFMTDLNSGASENGGRANG